MSARDDVYAVLVLLTELDRILFPHRGGGDSGGYGVEPGVPPPLPPTGLPWAPGGDARGSVALTAQEWVARGRGATPPPLPRRDLRLDGGSAAVGGRGSRQDGRVVPAGSADDLQTRRNGPSAPQPAVEPATGAKKTESGGLAADEGRDRVGGSDRSPWVDGRVAPPPGLRTPPRDAGAAGPGDRAPLAAPLDASGGARAAGRPATPRSPGTINGAALDGGAVGRGGAPPADAPGERAVATDATTSAAQRRRSGTGTAEPAARAVVGDGAIPHGSPTPGRTPEASAPDGSGRPAGRGLTRRPYNDDRPAPPVADRVPRAPAPHRRRDAHPGLTRNPVARARPATGRPATGGPGTGGPGTGRPATGRPETGRRPTGDADPLRTARTARSRRGPVAPLPAGNARPIVDLTPARPVDVGAPPLADRRSESSGHPDGTATVPARRRHRPPPAVVQAGRRSVTVTALDAVRLRRAVTAGYLDRVLRRGP